MKTKTVQASAATSFNPFIFSQQALREVSHDMLRIARTLGAAQTAVEVSESQGLSVSVRKGESESVEYSRDKSLGITIFLGSPSKFSHGSASTADFSAHSLQATVQAAYDIARYTAIDDCSGLPDLDGLYQGTPPDLSLYHPWEITTAQATQLALETENAAFATHKAIKNSDGASVSVSHGQFYQATQYGSDASSCQGFESGYAYSRHSLSVAPIASYKGALQRDYWYSSERNAAHLADATRLGRYAAQRTVSRLGARKIPTGNYPVLFEAPLACGLLGSLVQASSGGALYRDSTFLKDCLGKPVMAKSINVFEDPHIMGGVGSSYHDDEGTPTVARSIVDAGVLQTYFLSTYSARKLGMVSTGHAGGSHNLVLSHTATSATDDLAAMLRQLGTGLFVTELLGQGVNYVTGDYSRGASGYWVENGVIAHAVEEITIAGNMRDMLLNIVAVGADRITRGTKTTGSILLSNMAVAGS
jgi:PmbA protein